MTNHPIERETRVPHPSVFIREECEARGWSLLALARRMGGDGPSINLLVLQMYEEVGPGAPGMRLGERVAGELAYAFGVSAAFFLALETAWLRDTDGSPAGRDAQRLDGEAATAGAEGIAQTSATIIRERG